LEYFDSLGKFVFNKLYSCAKTMLWKNYQTCLNNDIG